MPPGPAADPPASQPTGLHRPGADWPFAAALWAFVLVYAGLMVALLGANVLFIWEDRSGEFSFFRRIAAVFDDPDIIASIRLTAVSCTVTAIICVILAVPIGYVLSRTRLPGRSLLDALFDVPIVLPPLVIGLSLLILFANTTAGRAVNDAVAEFFTWLGTRAGRADRALGVELFRPVYEFCGFHHWRGLYFQVPGVILAQVTVAAAFAIRTMRLAFDQLDARREQVALTLGCSRWLAFRRVVLPEVAPAVVAAGTLSWARALGEFGPILVFAGTTRGKVEVLSSTVFLETTLGRIENAVAVSLLMVTGAMATLVITRLATSGETWSRFRRLRGPGAGTVPAAVSTPASTPGVRR